MLFGLNVPASAAPGDDPIAYARLAEDLGFDYVSVSDHPSGTSPTYETWTMLTWIAATTTRVGIATRVLGVPYRNVAMVAKMAVTLDHLSGGRLILGLGGGYSDDEFRGFGIPVPSARDKVDGLEEAVQIIRGLWASAEFTFPGRIHRTAKADLEPKPTRHIPIWLGTFGPRALGVTGRLADGWIPSLSHATPEDIPAMRAHIVAAAVESGRDPNAITCAYNVAVHVANRVGQPPGTITGSVDAVAETLASYRRLGFTSINVSFVGPDVEDQTRQFAAEILPVLRRRAMHRVRA